MRFLPAPRPRGSNARSPRAVVALFALGALFTTAACSPASANSEGVWIKVSPTTVHAGNQTQIQASCGGTVSAATVASSAFGTVTLQPVAGVLGATVTIPANTPRGTHDVRLACPGGARATTTLNVLNTAAVPGQRMPGPDTGGGFLAQGQEPTDRAPFVWLGLGLACLIAAGVVALRTRLPRALLGTRRPVRSPQPYADNDPDPACGSALIEGSAGQATR
jgi:hypothetical protein